MTGDPSDADVVIPASQKGTVLKRHGYRVIVTGIFRARESGVVSFTSKSSPGGMWTDLLIAKQYQTESSDSNHRRESGDAFTTSHPIQFSLYDDDEKYILYIDDNPASQHVLHLELKNSSGKEIVLKDLRDKAASEENHHFELTFPSGALSRQTLETLKTSDGRDKRILGAEKARWDLAIPDKPETLRRIPIYLLYKGAETALRPDELRTLKLRNFTVAAAGGARPVKVQLRCKNLHYAGDQARAPIIGTRTQQLQIASHLGSREIPLHVGFVGGNQVVNDGKTETRLRLQLMNVARPREAHSTAVTFEKDKETFFLSIDLQHGKETKPWALGTTGDLVHLTQEALFVVKLDKQGNFEGGSENPTKDERWVVKKSDPGQGTPPQWVFTPTESMTLDQGKSLFISMSRLRSSLPSSSTNLYLQYKNVPGYWDGQFICPMEKTRLQYADPGKVKITGDLDVIDGRLDTPLLKTTNDSKGVDIKGDLRVYSHNSTPILETKSRTIKITGDLDVTDGRLVLPGPKKADSLRECSPASKVWSVLGPQQKQHVSIRGDFFSHDIEICYGDMETGEIYCHMDSSRRVHLSGILLLTKHVAYVPPAVGAHPTIPYFAISISLPIKCHRNLIFSHSCATYFFKNQTLVLLNHTSPHATAPRGGVQVMVQDQQLIAFGSFGSVDQDGYRIHHDVWISLDGLSYPAHATS